jgi:hypothetical protein
MTTRKTVITLYVCYLAAMAVAVAWLLFDWCTTPRRPVIPGSITISTPRGDVVYLWDRKLQGFRQVVDVDLINAPGGVERNPKP